MVVDIYQEQQKQYLENLYLKINAKKRISEAITGPSKIRMVMRG